ncbi:MAG: cellulase [Bacteroidetes bacterium GWA2_40_15]|nr:MAG: cellulase [Bacteroidetes bacterium GWA2_40_15]HBQ81999.1 cellulase [Bacteroidales bacterium]
MKNVLILSIFTFVLTISCSNRQSDWIRINQLGYRPGDVKVAVYISNKPVTIKTFSVIDVSTGKVAMTFEKVNETVPLDQFVSCYRLPFTDLRADGTYRIEAGDAVSAPFRIGKDVYDGTADFLLNYMRQQRCGYNPYLKDSCHLDDGYEIYDSDADSSHVDVTGGWHDAADYLQYVATSANAVYQMLFAYSENPEAFNDNYLANGDQGSDGIPDVLNESKWGLEWLIKMNPGPELMYNQLADDRDHIGFKLPNKDTAYYGKGKERPVYVCTGEPQGVGKYKNRATGIASTAGKFSSAFSKASEVYKTIDPELSATLLTKAKDAFNYGLKHPGVCQTAPCKAPYFYEEDNWADDMELAAIELHNRTGDKKYLDHAVEFGRQEPVTPWMGADTARHYQWYPFINMGHPGIARSKISKENKEFAGYMKKGLELTLEKGRKNPFLVGVPFIWCSNNLVAALITQAHLYNEITGDDTYLELEAAHRDWLFGCNPWGTSMIVGLPENGDYPEETHSVYVLKGGQTPGGLVDGPIYSSIYKNHEAYITLTKPDMYAQFQTKMAAYHDEIADYTSNEATMDGTACLVYYLSAMSSGTGKIHGNPFIRMSHGGIVRMDTTQKKVWLTFTAHEFADGFDTVLNTLSHHGAKASFFLTGDFTRIDGYDKLISRLKADGHYIGAHSDRHLLYCDWTKRDSLLVTKEKFMTDLKNNYKALEKHGITKEMAPVYLPPYEWYNDSISAWTREAGFVLVNISSGTITNQDWTVPDGKPYYSSEYLMKNFLDYEKKKGLNGYILLIHPGTDPKRTDKFYYNLDSILSYLENRGYSFHTFLKLN